MDSISALLQALKGAEAKAKKGVDLSDKPKGVVSITMVGKKPSDEELDDKGDMDALDMMKGMGDAVHEMGDEAEKRNYAPDQHYQDDVPASHHAAMVDALQERYPDIHAELLKAVGGGRDGLR